MTQRLVYHQCKPGTIQLDRNDDIIGEHAFILGDYRFFGPRQEQLMEWLQENTQGKWSFKGSVVSFEREDDALRFKIVWG